MRGTFNPVDLVVACVNYIWPIIVIVEYQHFIFNISKGVDTSIIEGLRATYIN